MKKLSILMLVVGIFAASLTSCTDSNVSRESKNTATLESAANKGRQYEINTTESNIEWTGKKVTGKHNGTVSITDGELFVDDGKLTGGNFTADFNTITVLDIEDKETNAKLSGHLKSEDFFSAASHPTGTFVITSLDETSDNAGNNYLLKGNLTIKGITNEITVPAKVSIEENKITANANIELDRTLWDIRYGSGKFFDNLGDKVIDDKFSLKINILAN